MAGGESRVGATSQVFPAFISKVSMSPGREDHNNSWPSFTNIQSWSYLCHI